MDERFDINIFPLWRPLFWLFGATRSRSFVRVTNTTFMARLGWYRFAVARSNIVSAEAKAIPWWWGRGWRTNLRDILVLAGNGSPAVKLTLAEPVKTRLLLIPLRVRRLWVNVEDVQRLVDLLNR